MQSPLSQTSSILRFALLKTQPWVILLNRGVCSVPHDRTPQCPQNLHSSHTATLLAASILQRTRSAMGRQTNRLSVPAPSPAIVDQSRHLSFLLIYSRIVSFWVLEFCHLLCTFVVLSLLIGLCVVDSLCRWKEHYRSPEHHRSSQDIPPFSRLVYILLE